MSRTEGSAVREEESGNVRNMPLADLLAAVALEDADHALADAALEELHGRWGERIDGLSRRLTVAFPGKLIGWQTLATEVWDWLWSSAGTFEATGLSGDDLDARFYRWIEISAQHRLRDLLRVQKRTALAELPSDASLEAESGEAKPRVIGIFSPPPPGSRAADDEMALFAGFSAETRAAIECLRTLSPKDQSVLQAAAPYLRPGEREVAIPESAHAEMVKSLNTTVLGLRALRCRAFKKVDDCMKIKARKRNGGA